MSHKLKSTIAVIGIDIGKNSFHVVGHDERGAIKLRQKWSRGQVEGRGDAHSWPQLGLQRTSRIPFSFAAQQLWHFRVRGNPTAPHRG